MEQQLVILIVFLVCALTAAIIQNIFRMYHPHVDDSDEEEDIPYIPRHVVTRVDPDAGRILPIPPASVTFEIPRSAPIDIPKRKTDYNPNAIHF
jgi:hypothetical protein